MMAKKLMQIRNKIMRWIFFICLCLIPRSLLLQTKTCFATFNQTRRHVACRRVVTDADVIVNVDIVVVVAHASVLKGRSLSMLRLLRRLFFGQMVGQVRPKRRQDGRGFGSARTAAVDEMNDAAEMFFHETLKKISQVEKKLAALNGI